MQYVTELVDQGFEIKEDIYVPGNLDNQLKIPVG